jgi:hypothetical protein
MLKRNTNQHNRCYFHLNFNEAYFKTYLKVIRDVKMSYNKAVNWVKIHAANTGLKIQ